MSTATCAGGTTPDLQVTSRNPTYFELTSPADLSITHTPDDGDTWTTPSASNSELLSGVALGASVFGGMMAGALITALLGYFLCTRRTAARNVRCLEL